MVLDAPSKILRCLNSDLKKLLRDTSKLGKSMRLKGRKSMRRKGRKSMKRRKSVKSRRKRRSKSKSRRRRSRRR